MRNMNKIFMFIVRLPFERCTRREIVYAHNYKISTKNLMKMCYCSLNIQLRIGCGFFFCHAIISQIIWGYFMRVLYTCVIHEIIKQNYAKSVT